MPLATTLLLLAVSAAPATQGPEDLVYQCEDLAPSNFLRGGRVEGISADLLRRIWSKMGVPEQRIEVVPWARGYEEIRKEPGRVLFSMTRSREREDLFRWVGPIFEVRNVLLARKGAPHPGSVAEAGRLRIGTIRGDVLESELLGAGIPRERIEPVESMEQNFEKLRLGRIDAIAHTTRSIREFELGNHLDTSAFEVVLTLSTSSNYYAFSRSTDPALVRRFQTALDQLRPVHDSLLAAWRLGR